MIEDRPIGAALSRNLGSASAPGEKVEAEIDHFIRHRHDRRVAEEGERPSEELWMKSERRHEEQCRMQARYEWHLHHTAQAERLRRTLEELVNYHETQAERLLTEG